MSEKFYGVKITDATGRVYYTEVEVNHNLTHNTRVVSNQPIDSRVPYHTIVGKPYYWSGTVIGAFENNQNGECEHDYDFGDTEFRLQFIEWMHNGLTKTLYLSDSFVIQATILGEINVETENTVDDTIVKTTFSWEADSDRFTSRELLTCSACGQILDTSTNFCPHCGQAVM